MRNDILSTYPTPQSEELLYPPQQWVEPETKALTMDELIRSNRDLEQLAFAASHDLQEPLKVISLYLEFFNKKYKGRLDEKADQIIFSILDRSERMQKLVQNMLSYAQVGKENTPFVRIDSAVALTRAIENLKVSIDENSARITYDDCPVIMGDEVQLTQLFQNLINNAIKFRKKGELPYIHVSAKRTEGHWLFSIQDNGIGIDNEHIQGIFEIFKRLHAHSEYAGHGIGLALCKRTVEFHRGNIWAASEIGQGTVIYFTIPQI